jgi:hypothetical protein
MKEEIEKPEQEKSNGFLMLKFLLGVAAVCYMIYVLTK